MTTLTIAIDDRLAHALLMAKHDYLVSRVLPSSMAQHDHRMVNYDALNTLYIAIREALDAAAAAHEADHARRVCRVADALSRR